jgi:hypothetical protein
VVNAFVKDSVAEIDEDVLPSLPRINRPPFDPDTDITHKEVLEIDATAPGVVGLEITVIFPIISCEDIGTPKANVKLSVGIPLRARRRSGYLFYFFPGIAHSGKSSRSDHTEP